MSMLAIFLLVPVLGGLLLLVNLLLAASRPDAEKLSPYECGMPVLAHQARAPFNVSFYLVGILFLIFDLEILVIWPIAVSLYQATAYAYWILMLFIAILTLGFAYEYGKGALKFTDQRSALNRRLL
jgi:NADH:ubiquinone oxidoreductase subunit 3 (subunit A)